MRKRIGLIDVDGKGFPNLALMRISAYHKDKGDDVEWAWGFGSYDVIYKSKVFSDAYTPDTDDFCNCDRIIKGGTGYAIKTVNGREIYDASLNPPLPKEIERMPPDKTIYPQAELCLAMTTRGCPRNCSFCHVTQKEGRISRKVADVSDFWNGEKKIISLDANITACKDKHILFRQYADTGAKVDFSQGLDIRLLTDSDIDDINDIRLDNIHFAWDNPQEDLKGYFERYAKRAKHRPHGDFGTVYVLTNYGESLEDDLRRIYTLRDLGFMPDVRIYNKPNAPMETRLLQRWVNNKIVFKKCERFEDFDRTKG